MGRALDPDYDRKYHIKNRVKRRDQFLRRVYGVSLEEYAALAESQGGRCAICGQAPPRDAKGPRGTLHVDHNHVTGRIRQLLCANCNAVLGYARDDARVLASAIDYLGRHG